MHNKPLYPDRSLKDKDIKILYRRFTLFALIVTRQKKIFIEAFPIGIEVSGLQVKV
jgi:hypothetical protein